MKIDPILLMTLRKHGLSDRAISRMANDVATGDARTVRYLSDTIGGMVAYDREEDTLVGVIAIMRGVHWCAGQLRIAPEAASIPETVLQGLPGSPVRRVMEHDALPADTMVTGLADTPGAFAFIGSAAPRDVHAAHLNTDVEPVDLPDPVGPSLTHPVMRMVRDSRYRESPLSWWKGEPLAATIGIVGLTMLASSMIYAAGLTNLLRNQMVWTVAGLVCSVILVRIGFMIHGGEHRKVNGWVHREARRRHVKRLRQTGY